MRCISQYGEYGVQIRPQFQRGMGDGSIQVTQEPLYAKFEREGLIYENEMERAMKVFPFRGLNQHLDEATPVNPGSRMSVLDTATQNWSDEDRKLAEDELRRLEPVNNDFFISEETPIKAPYPAWDNETTPAFEMVANLVRMESDLQLALDYEKIFGPKREGLIEALEETLKAESPEMVSA